MALDRREIRDLYGRRAARYDVTANLYYLLGFREWAYRKRAVAALALEPGDSVVERVPAGARRAPLHLRPHPGSRVRCRGAPRRRGVAAPGGAGWSWT